jgi:hypothetical protein
VQRSKKCLLAVLRRQNGKAFGCVSESHGELRIADESRFGGDAAIVNVEMAARSTQRLNLENELFSFHIFGACRIVV